MKVGFFKPQRRWLQFSLRSLLLQMTAVVVLLVAWRQYFAAYQQQRRTMALVEKLGGRCQTVAAGKCVRWIYGSDFQNITLVDLADCDDLALYLDAVVALPCLETLVVGGTNFTDDHLQRLRKIHSLRGLVLDSTSVSDEGLASLIDASPQVECFKSQRRAIAYLERFGPIAARRALSNPSLRALVGDAHFRLAPGFDGYLLSDSDAALLRRLSTLRILWLTCRTLTCSGLRHLEGLKDVEQLKLTLTGADDDQAGLKHLQGLTSLRTLEVGVIYVNDEALSHLRELTNLEELRLFGRYGASRDAADLTGNQITGRGLEHLKNLPSLKRLFFHRAEITDDGFEQLKSMKNLRSLSIGTADVTPDVVQQLRQSLPNCDVDVRNWWEMR